ncbi:hypothetical protein BV20DRAFT_1121415 [Pilatotrama ljubarskyi]|nr:hypothetical protein BV20DRAFT_1121415 [Pilatotrama ljubarskyi]
MTEDVPDEVLEVILQHTLIIPEVTFESWRTPSTFAGSPRTHTSDVLLVSRRWHDLGDPWLFESAILRTGKQVAGFARSLGKANARGVKRARYLRRLRIEGGYGNRFNQVLGAAPGIVTLFMGFDISLDDSSAGLKRALQRINPSKLLMDATPGRHDNTQNALSLHAAVGTALSSWTHLKRIDTSPEFTFWEPLWPPLKNLPALEYVSMATKTVNSLRRHPVLENLALNPSVKIIQIRDGARWLKVRRSGPDYPREKLYLGEGKNMTPCIEFPLNDVVRPHPAALPDLPDKLWSRILGYATHVHGYDYLELDDESVKLSAMEKVNWTRRSVLLVNRHFHRLGLRYLYSVPHFASNKAIIGFIERVNSSEDIASFVRVLYVDDKLPVPLEARISVPLVKLVRVNTRFQVLPDLDSHLGPGQTARLEWAAQVLTPSTAVAPPTFLRFPYLRHLVLHGGHGEQIQPVCSAALPQLECLSLYNSGPGMFSVFLVISLPRLREFRCSLDQAGDAMDFLRTHGAKLETLSLKGIALPIQQEEELPVLDLCPNLLRLILDRTRMPRRIPFVASSAPHRAFKQLIFRSLSVRHPKVPAHEQRWYTFFDFLVKHRHKVPVLEECRIMTDFPWPMHQTNYMYGSYATPMALDLHELGIALADRDGTRWTRFDPMTWRRPRKSSGMLL